MASLAVVSGTAGITGSAEREARRHRDDALAAALRESGTASFVEDWYRRPMWRSLRAHPRSAPQLDNAMCGCTPTSGISTFPWWIRQTLWVPISDRWLALTGVHLLQQSFVLSLCMPISQIKFLLQMHASGCAQGPYLSSCD